MENRVNLDKYIVRQMSRAPRKTNGSALLYSAAAFSEIVSTQKLAEWVEELKGIKWLGEPEKGELNGLKAAFLNGNVTLEGVKMAVNCAVFAPKGGDTFFMLFNVVPLESLKEHGDEIEKVLKSIKGK